MTHPGSPLLSSSLPLTDSLPELINTLEALLGDLAAPMALWDRDFILRWANSAYADLRGQPRAEVTGRCIFEVWPGANPEFRELCHRLVAGNGVTEAQLPFTLPDGRLTYWTLTNKPVHGADGRVVAVLSIGREITEQVLARQRAEAAQQTIQRILDALPVMLSLWNTAGELELLNASARRYWRDRLGEPPVPGSPAPPVQIYHLDGRPVVTEETPMYQAKLSGQPVTGKPMLVRLASGEMEPLQFTAVPLWADDGRYGGMLVVGADPRPEWEYQQLVERANALAADARLKSHLLASVSHELRTPLSHITGYAEALRRHDATLTPTTRLSYLETILEAADQLRRLIDDLLDASQIEAGGLAIARGVVRVPEVAARVIERARLAAPGRTLTLAFSPAFPPVPGDSGRIEQVLENLVGNTLRHAPGADIVVGGRARRTVVEVWVRDNGPGFPAEWRAHAFEPLTRCQARHSEGLGLGLAICRGIVEAHGGRIWAPTHRRGAAVHFELPRRARRAADRTRHDDTGEA